MCKFVVLLNKPVAFLKFLLLVVVSSLLTALDHPRQLITEHSFPWITCTAHQRHLKNKQTDDITGPTVQYKTLYNKDKRTEKLVNNILHKYHNPYIPKLTRAYCNSTKLNTLLLTLHIRDLSFIRGREGWYNVFSQVNFFLPFPNFLQKKTVTLPLVWPKKVMSLPTLKDMTGIINKLDQL